MCLVCWREFTSESPAIDLGCGHVACRSCITRLKNCPVCEPAKEDARDDQETKRLVLGKKVLQTAWRRLVRLATILTKLGPLGPNALPVKSVLEPKLSCTKHAMDAADATALTQSATPSHDDVLALPRQFLPR